MQDAWSRREDDSAARMECNTSINHTTPRTSRGAGACLVAFR